MPKTPGSIAMFDETSGIGRELGWSGILANTEEKTITIVVGWDKEAAELVVERGRCGNFDARARSLRQRDIGHLLKLGEKQVGKATSTTWI